MADFLGSLNNLNFNYGTTPDVPVAEQNQTYFAYWNGIGGTGPEYINGTAYFIKYLIDINGNVVNPEPYVETTSIDAVALHNLKANFEVGKRVIVKTIEPDPTQNEPTDYNILNGLHRIAHVGKIIPVLVTETGPNQLDYVTTMSFEPPDNGLPPSSPSPQTYFVPNMSGQFQYPAGEVALPDASFTNLPYSTTLTAYTNTNMWTNNSSYIQVASSSQETHTRIKLEAKIRVEAGDAMYIDGQFIYPSSNFRLRILQNGEQIVLGDLVTYAGNVSTYTVSTPNWIDYEADDTFEVEYTVDNEDNDATGPRLKIEGAGGQGATSILKITQETPPITTTTGGGSNEPLVIDGINAVYQNSDYLTAVNHPAENGGYSIITCNSSLSNIYFSNTIQIIHPSSSLFGFSPVNVSFSSLKPGDFIRFEYNKNQTYTIVNVYTTESTGLVNFQIVPSLSTISGSQTQTMDINHFQIYRVLNDGLYITLDVPKDTPTNTYTGLLIPEFISQELSEKLETLIKDLTEKEIIQ